MQAQDQVEEVKFNVTTDYEGMIFASDCERFLVSEDATYGYYTLHLAEDAVYSIAESATLRGLFDAANKYVASMPIAD